ncbi:MAG: universal stress protein [Planctomycetes bacterium]|nr:universal stress protein [Planctomycetota bacterium]
MPWTDPGAHDDFLALLERSRQGRLKVYVGYAPGVGKTHRMLQEAHLLRQRGVDVVLGFVDARGRADPLAAELPQVPPRRVTYRGITVDELDLDALLARRPTVAVVDDLAHTNAPGARHRRRHEDVLALLDAGVNVIGAFNVQHLESLNDTVRRATGVVVRDTVPDALLGRADHVVNVDLPVGELLERVRAGKVDGGAPGLAPFLAAERLDALRELTLRELAEDVHRRRSRRADAAPAADDRVVVALASASPRASALVRRGSRLAGHLHARWYVVHVAPPGAAGDAVQRRLDEHLDLARALGAEVVRLEGRDVTGSLLEFARRHGAQHLVVGAPLRRTWRDALTGSIADRLVRGARGIGVYVMTFDEEAP